MTQITEQDVKNVTAWHTKGWEAEYFAPYLCITSPDGNTGLVQLKDTKTGRNITLRQFRSSVLSHGILRACQTFWKLRAC